MLVAQTKDLTSAQKQITAMVCISLYIVLHTWFTSRNIYVDYEMQERGVGRKNMFLWTVIWCNLWPFYLVTPCRKYIHVLHVHIVHLTRLHTVVALTVWLHRACCLQETELDQKKADRHSLLKTCKVYTSLTMWEDGWVATLACWFRWRRLTYQWWGEAWMTLEMKRYSCCVSFPLFSFCPSPSSPSSTSFSSFSTPPLFLPPFSLHTPPTPLSTSSLLWIFSSDTRTTAVDCPVCCGRGCQWAHLSQQRLGPALPWWMLTAWPVRSD